MSPRDLQHHFRTLLGLLVIVGAGAMFYLQREANKRTERAVESTRETAAAPARAPETARIRELRQIQYRDPETALASCEQILAQPASDGEKTDAQGIHQMLLDSCFSWRLKNHRPDDALALRQRLRELYPDARQNQSVQTQWTNHLQAEAQKAIAARDWPAAEATMNRLFAEPITPMMRPAFEQWQRALLDLWFEAVQQKTPGADGLLRSALPVVAHTQHNNPVLGQINRGRLPGQRLLEIGDNLARGEEPHAALWAWAAAARELESRGNWTGDPKKPLNERQRPALTAAVRARLVEGWQALGTQLEQGRRLPYVLIDADEAYESAWQAAANQPEEADALRRYLAFRIGGLRTKLVTILGLPFEKLGTEEALTYEERNKLIEQAYKARAEISGVHDRAGVQLWRLSLEDPAFDPWAIVPESVVAELTPIQAGLRPTEAEKARRRSLDGHFQRSNLPRPLPELAPLHEMRYALLARWGLLEFTGPTTADAAFDKLREALRGTADAGLRTAVTGALKARLQATGAKKDFEKFYLLAGFYAAEVGLPPATDPFRRELQRSLTEGAVAFKGTAKQIFLLTLLAELFPDEPVGTNARQQAFEQAFTLVAGMAPEADRDPVSPSGQPALSLHRINNSTQYHLLCFYKGDEQFFVRSSPYRRGTAVMKNGGYEIVVLCPDGDIRPFRGSIAMNSAVRTSDYVVKSSGGAGGPSPLAGAGASAGDYRLLRMPPGVAPLAIDRNTGLAGR